MYVSAGAAVLAIRQFGEEREEQYLIQERRLPELGRVLLVQMVAKQMVAKQDTLYFTTRQIPQLKLIAKVHFDMHICWTYQGHMYLCLHVHVFTSCMCMCRTYVCRIRTLEMSCKTCTHFLQELWQGEQENGPIPCTHQKNM